MSSVSVVVDLNAQSVACLQEGKYEEASRFLLRALEEMKRNILQANAATVSSKLLQTEVEPTSDSSFHVDAVSVCSPNKQQGQQEHNNQLLSCYLHAFLIPVTPTTKEERAIALMACVYNLGLCRHLHSLSTTTTSSSKLQLLGQAAKLYESALKVASTHIQGEDAFTKVHWLVLATANNFGHVHAERYNLEEAGKCIAMMQTLLGDRSVVLGLPSGDLSFFESNVITFLESPFFAIAPAA